MNDLRSLQLLEIHPFSFSVFIGFLPGILRFPCIFLSIQPLVSALLPAIMRLEGHCKALINPE